MFFCGTYEGLPRYIVGPHPFGRFVNNIVHNLILNINLHFLIAITHYDHYYPEQVVARALKNKSINEIIYDTGLQRLCNSSDTISRTLKKDYIYYVYS